MSRPQRPSLAASLLALFVLSLAAPGSAQNQGRVIGFELESGLRPVHSGEVVILTLTNPGDENTPAIAATFRILDASGVRLASFNGTSAVDGALVVEISADDLIGGNSRELIRFEASFDVTLGTHNPIWNTAFDQPFDLMSRLDIDCSPVDQGMVNIPDSGPDQLGGQGSRRTVDVDCPGIVASLTLGGSN